jgi:uncharacterized RDD family membrane protein YckC
MRRSSRTPEDEEPSLFDLPLETGGASRAERPAAPDDDPILPLASPAPRALPAAPNPQTARQPAKQPAAPKPAAKPGSAARSAELEDLDGEAPAARDATPSAKPRLLAGTADLLVHAAVAVAVIAGSRLLGATPKPSDWPAVALFVLTFSFLYTVLPSAFWGQTLGMAWANLIARGKDGEALTFDQAARRWLGALLTAATAGLPLLATNRRRSVSDLVSGSVTGWAGDRAS